MDWDNLLFAPKERDLALIGACYTWRDARETDWFYQGYGLGRGDAAALSYYRCERIIQDIAAYSEQLLLTSAGGADRERSYALFTGLFLPGRDVEIAVKLDAGG